MFGILAVKCGIEGEGMWFLGGASVLELRTNWWHGMKPPAWRNSSVSPSSSTTTNVNVSGTARMNEVANVNVVNLQSQGPPSTVAVPTAGLPVQLGRLQLMDAPWRGSILQVPRISANQ